MRVLVVHPPMSVAPDFVDYPYLSDLGAVQIAAALRAAGHEVSLVDAFALTSSGASWRADDRALLGAPVADVLAAATPADAVVVTLTPWHRPPERDEILGALLSGLAGDAPIVLADACQSAQHYLASSDGAVLGAYPEAAAYVAYEAEATLPEVLANAATGTVRGVPPDLAALPFPAWDLVDLGARDAFMARAGEALDRDAWAFPGSGRILPLVTSRGCTYACAHCTSNPGLPAGEAKLQRRYPAERLESYLRELYSVHGATRLAVLDDMMNVDARHFARFLDVADELDVSYEIPNGLRADRLERRHLERMHGRVVAVSIGAESGSQRVLDACVGKDLDLAHVTRVAKEAHEVEVPLTVHYLVGLPGESAEEINDTLEYALTLWDEHQAFPSVRRATAMPGTRLAGEQALPAVDDATLTRFMTTFHGRLEASMGPQKLIINVTYVCNNHCKFCAVGTRTQIDGHPTRQREHLEKYRRHGVHMVDFDGGEPTLNPELIPLIRYARSIGYDRINVTTNGRLLTYPDNARKLVRSGLTTLLFSVHGATARSHRREVGVAEAFEQTMNGIQNAVAAAPPGVELGMNITLTKHNYEELEDVGQLALDLGLRWMNVQFLTPFGRATIRHAPDTQAAADVAMRFIDRFHERMKIQLVNLPFCYVPGYEQYANGDLNKLRRHMVFVNNETVNLGDYLAERRSHRAQCGPCPHRCFCGGFYDLEDAPEPPWLVSLEALERPVDPSI